MTRGVLAKRCGALRRPLWASMAAILALAGCGDNGGGDAIDSAAMTPEQRGRRAFAPCAACHSVTDPAAGGPQVIGPNLYGVVGRRSAAVRDYAYSSALRRLNVVWDEATLDRYIESPNAFVRGSRMSFPGEPDQAKRADIIAFLAAQGPSPDANGGAESQVDAPSD